MRSYYVLLFCFITVACSTGGEQLIQVPAVDSFCDLGISSAEIDFNNHHLKLAAERTTGRVYDSLLKADYGLSTYFASKDEDGIMRCYDSVMANMLSKKYGKNILKSSFEKSRLLEFYQQSGVEAEQLEMIDFSDLIRVNYLTCLLLLESNGTNTQVQRLKIQDLLLSS